MHFTGIVNIILDNSSRRQEERTAKEKKAWRDEGSVPCKSERRKRLSKTDGADGNGGVPGRCAVPARIERGLLRQKIKKKRRAGIRSGTPRLFG